MTIETTLLLLSLLGLFLAGYICHLTYETTCGVQLQCYKIIIGISLLITFCSLVTTIFLLASN